MTTRWALIVNAVCQTVIEIDTPQPAEVGFWINVTANPERGVGWTYSGGVWTAPSAAVPNSVTNRQLRLALNSAGDYADFVTGIGSESTAVQIEWGWAANINRYGTIADKLATILLYDDAQIDALFIVAASS